MSLPVVVAARELYTEFTLSKAFLFWTESNATLKCVYRVTIDGAARGSGGAL